jgi:hypothetical protein
MIAGIALAAASSECVYCQGLGVPAKGKKGTCNCVYREIFRSCLRGYHNLELPPVRIAPYGESTQIHNMRGSRMRGADFRADFVMLAKRTLPDELLSLFRSRFLNGEPRHIYMRRMDLDRGEYWHLVYRVSVRMGRAIADSEPYSLYPVSDYFGAGKKFAYSTLAMERESKLARMIVLRPNPMRRTIRSVSLAVAAAA